MKTYTEFKLLKENKKAKFSDEEYILSSVKKITKEHEKLFDDLKNDRRDCI